MNYITQGACFDSQGNCKFTFFAPESQNLCLRITHKETKDYPMKQDSLGYHTIYIKNCPDHASYCLMQSSGTCLPDPASRFQPDGVTGKSLTINHHLFDWQGDNFSGLPSSEMIIYETHIGTFTKEGTFKSAISHLDSLQELGINTILLMPVAQFSGTKDWGYLNVFPFAVQNSYGTPAEFKEFIRQCHLRGIAVILEMSLSSITPQGNMFCSLAPFESSCHLSQEGPAINFDGNLSYGIREFYIQSGISWLIDYHIDGLKISCADRIIDSSPVHFLKELADRVKELEAQTGKVYMLATEDTCGGLTPIRAQDKGGYGFNAIFSDDFHNALFAAMSDNKTGIYNEYKEKGKIAEALQNGRCFHGEFSKTRKNYYGQPDNNFNDGNFIVYSLDHRLAGRYPSKSRNIKAAGFRFSKLAAGATLLTPFIPLIFMGEEFAAENNFHFFCSPCSKKLSKTVFKARLQEMQIYSPQTAFPDPEDEKTYRDSILCWDQANRKQGRELFNLYRDLIQIRKENPALKQASPQRTQVWGISPEIFLVIRNCGSNVQIVATLFNFSKSEQNCDLSMILPGRVWQTILCSEEEKFGGNLKELPPAELSTSHIQPAKSFTVLRNISHSSLV